MSKKKPSADASDRMTPQVFYDKLFSALEAGKKKGEKTLLAQMAEDLELSNEPDLRAALIAAVPPERAIVWLLSTATPFVKMLEEIYVSLADLRATVLGGADQLGLVFADLNERVPFPLDAFPKTYLRALTDVELLTTRFSPDARGHLMIDPPNYWWDDVPALRQLSRSWVLDPSTFDKLPREHQEFVRSRVQIVLKVLDANYVAYDVPTDTDEHTLRKHRRVYFSDQSLLDEVLRLSRVPRRRHDEGYSSPSSTLIRQGQDAGTIVVGDDLLKCLQHANQLLGPDPSTIPADVDFPLAGRDSNLLYAFVVAYDLCFQTRSEVARDYVDVIDKVFLPFYRYRWRLFEIWAILWLRGVIPQRCRPQPCLSRRTDDPTYFEWIIPGGSARFPVATWERDGKAVDIWYQMNTPLTPEQAIEFRQEHIEPDLRIRSGAVGDTSDVAILELKDRFQAQGSEEKRIARMYATTPARLICVANYSEFGSKGLRGQIFRETTPTGATILLVDQFMPGRVRAELSDAFAGVFALGGGWPSVPYDLLCDISNSMPRDTLSRATQKLVDANVLPLHTFTFDTLLTELPGGIPQDWPDGGGTDVATVLQTYLTIARRSPSGKVLILTDADGVTQVTHAISTGSFAALDMLCTDADELNAASVVAWAER